MGWVEKLRGKTVAIESPPLIYFIERHSTYHNLVLPFFEALAKGEFSAVTSTITITEVLVHPLKNGNAALIEEFRKMFLNTDHFKTIAVTPDIAETAAGLRASHGIRTPDAIHVATAIHCNADILLTNDIQLGSLPKPEVLLLTDIID